MFKHIAATLVLGTSMALPAYASTLYATDNFSLYTVDIDSGVEHFVANIVSDDNNVRTITDLASSDTELFGRTPANPALIQSINPTNGVASRQNALSNNNIINGIAYDKNLSVLFGLLDNTLKKVDLNGISTVIGDFDLSGIDNENVFSGVNLGIDNAGRLFSSASFYDKSFDELKRISIIEIDPNDGSLVNNWDFNFQDFIFDFNDEVIADIAFDPESDLGYFTFARKIFSFNADSGSIDFISNLSGDSFVGSYSGLAFLPGSISDVPEPAPYGLLGLGVLLAGLARRKRVTN